jgi:hypothetical protein
MSREKARQPKCLSSALSQQDQNSNENADICKVHKKKCRTRSMLHKIRRARAESPDGTPVQRVEHAKKGWGDVRASTGKRGTATHDLHHTWKCPLRRTSRTETCKREAPKFRIATIEKARKEKTHP